MLVNIDSDNGLLFEGTKSKPLPEPMLTYCKLDPYEQIWVKFYWKYNFSFIQENAFKNVVCNM